MTWKSPMTLLAILLSSSMIVRGDTFKNKTTGESFVGFRTQKESAGKTLVFNDQEKKLITMDLTDYEITFDDKGRRNSVVMVSITDPEALLSEAVSKAVSDAIIKASNTGPRFVLLKIDNPGGRGEYMKEICNTITKTQNCKIVAYISGGRFGGAFSSAAVIASACDKVYISPTASISSVGPFVSISQGLTEEDFVKTFSSDSLASYGVYAATLAENKHKPGLLSRALLDKKLSLIETIDSEGTVSIVERDLRQPTQSTTRVICEGLQPINSNTPATVSDSASPITTAATDLRSRVLSLSAEDAVRFKFADAVSGTIQSLLADMKAPDAQVANSPGIDTIVKQFVAAKRSIGQSLARITTLEDRAASLNEQLKSIEKQIRATPITRSTTRNANQAYTRGRNNMTTENMNDPANPQQQYLDQAANTAQQTQQNKRKTTLHNTPQLNNTNNAYSRDNYGTTPVQETETVTTAEPSTSFDQVRLELSSVLNNLIGEYRTAISNAKRWPGVLPPDLTIQSLEKNLDSTTALSNNLLRRY